MARTKKQTIDAATERKRQYQEEIHNQTLIENTKKGEKVDSSCSETTNAKLDKLRIRPSKLSDVIKEESSRMSSPSPSKSTDDSNVLPQAVVRVTDICRSPSDVKNEDSCRKTRDSSPRNKDTRDSSPRNRDISVRGIRETRDSSTPNRETCSAKNIFEVMEMTPPKKRSPKKTSSSPKSKELEESLKALKSESERVRLEKSKKHHSQTDESSKFSPTPSPSHKQTTPSPGRRSPRNQSPSSSLSQNKITSSPESPGGVERKINIFTDDIGKDLGKRIRSPRRLSEDMIALPIFSLRAKSGQSPKEGAGFSKYANDGVGFADSVSNSSSSNIFKSPQNIPLSPCRKLSAQKSSESADTFLKQPSAFAGGTMDDGDDYVKDQSSEKTEKSQGSLMSSICRDVVKEMASNRRDLFWTKNEKPNIENGGGDSLADSEMKECSVNKLTSVQSENISESSAVGESGDASSYAELRSTNVNSDDRKLSEVGNSSNNDNNDNASLLCAMLVGGSNVVEDYSQKRQRYNPEVMDISDSETEQSRPASPSPKEDQKQVGKIKVEKIDEESVDDSQTENRGISEDTVDTENVECQVPNVDKEEIDDFVKSQEISMECEDLDTKNNETEAVDNEMKPEIEEDMSDHNTPDSKEEIKLRNEDTLKGESEAGGLKDIDQNLSKQAAHRNPENQKSNKIEILSQLKKVNEDVLKLLDIDVEDQFMSTPDPEEIIKDTVTEKETKLYKLISDLCNSLKDNPSSCDTCEIDNIVETCPKGFVHAVSSSFSDRKWDNILSRLKHEKSAESKRAKHRLKRELMNADMEKLVEKMSASTLQSTNEESNDCIGSDLKVIENSEKNSVQSKEEQETVSSLNEGQKVCDATSNLKSASSSSLNGSLCDLDIDSMTHAATQAFKISDDHISDSVSEPGTSSMTFSSEEKSLEEDKSNIFHMTRRFQKSKTCGDFSKESLSAPSTPSRSGTLRRTNSSPQLLKSDASVSSRSNSPCLGKDQQVKSKLGGKIPVPGASYSFRNTKRILRKPRIIMDPKPLDILLQFVNDNKDSKDVFCSQDLQKFLWMPSNRMIVTPAICNEISKADKTAEEAWEKKLQLMQEEEERQKKKDEEVDKEFGKYEPGFDEVDGHLFMSFSSEAELIAHVRVEKALEWDKDDTMLRIARAKHFEETKAINGDMSGVKMKRLRGQHMRWKKYKRLYGHQVEAVLTAKEKNIPLEDIKILEKTSDVSKIKGWKKKASFGKPPPTPEAKENEMVNVCYTPQTDTPVISSYSSLASTAELTDFQNDHNMDENNSLDKRDMTIHQRRSLNFSDRKSHKQLFRELKMDWEDRMIHKKLGGWSLKGNRPKEFSQAAKKRELKESKALGLEVPSPRRNPSRSADANNDPFGKRKRVVFPLITERMAHRCLVTLELSNDLHQAVKSRKKRKRFRGANFNRSINTRSSLPPDILPTMTKTSHPSTPQSSLATAGSMDKAMDVSTPEASVSMSLSTPNTTASPSLSLDLPEDTVMEGVEIVSHASPSVTESETALNSPHIKCSKLGCRYGCICHLLQSPVAKTPVQNCNKEYCRLGCICDSLESEQPTPSHQPHCGKPSCMLECCCSPTSGGGNRGLTGEDNEDVKKRPSRAGERFSNLPRREKSHRSAKNLDAITRKAMMLYETSEIYCEKVERTTKKKPESFPILPNSLPMSVQNSTHQSFNPLNDITATTSTARTPSVSYNHNDQLHVVVERAESPVSMAPSSTVAFNAVNLVTSEVATVAASQFSSSRSQLFPWKSRRLQQADARVDIEVDEVRQTLPVMEPSTHKRKRKSHPLSDEIFAISSCARIQPHAWSRDRAAKLQVNLELIEYQARQFTTSSTQSTSPPVPDNPPTPPHSSSCKDSGKKEMNLKISSVCTISEEDHKNESNQSKMDTSSKVVDLTIPTSSSDEKCVIRKRSSQKPEYLYKPTLSSSNQTPVHSKDIRAQAPTQPQNWHTSMVCLKARAPPKSATNDEGAGDDVQEEDEVKLLEFAANCNWDRAKKEILSRVASCLVRGRYPYPRMMSVGDFLVEILPKAKSPSVIPPTLRVKLPGQMYSIRVRITKRDGSLLPGSGDDCDAPVIDLSKSSPVKEPEQQKGNSVENKSGAMKNLGDNFSYTTTVVSSLPTSLSSSSKINMSSPLSSVPLSSSSLSLSKQTVSDSSIRSSIGISGLNRIYNINPVKNPLNTIPHQTTDSKETKSAPSSRRSSIENYNDDSLSTPPVTAKALPLLDMSKVQIINRPAMKKVTNSAVITPNKTASNALDTSAEAATSNRTAATLNKSSKPPNSSNTFTDISVSTTNTSSDNSLISPNRLSPGNSQIASRLSPTNSHTTSNRISDIPVLPTTSNISVTPNPLTTITAVIIDQTKGTSVDGFAVSPSLSTTSSRPSGIRPTNPSTHQPAHPHNNHNSVHTPMTVAFTSSVPPHNLLKKVGSSAATSLLNPDTTLRKERPNLKVPSFAMATPGKTAISPTAVNELKYIQMLYEVEGQNEKKKTLIAVPISLTGTGVIDGKTQSTMPILTVPKPGAQAKSLPITIAPRNKSKLPQVISGPPIIMKLPPNLTSTTSKSVQLIPISSVSSMLSKTSVGMANKLTVVLPSSASATSTNSPSLNANANAFTIQCNNVEQSPDRNDDITQQKPTKALEGTSVTQSRVRPIPSTEVSPPREIIPSSSSASVSSSSMVDTSCAPSNDVTKTGTASSLSNNIEKDDASKENEIDGSAQHTNDRVVMEAGGQSFNNSISHQSINQISIADEVEVKNVGVAEPSKGLCGDKGLVGEHHFPDVTVDNKPAQSTETRPSEIQTLHSELVIPPENNDSVYEIVDMDDLLVTCTSDVVTTVGDECTQSSSKSNENGVQLEQYSQQESLSSGSRKRKMSPDLLEDAASIPPGSKKPRQLTEISGIMDEDSNLSSLITASPQSLTSLQKSAFSSGRSTGSMEDVISSADEEIDVGEHPSSYKNRVEKAWENDHSSMFSKYPPRPNPKMTRHVRKKEAVMMDSKGKVEYHNLLERNRRAKLKELFDNLGNTILSVGRERQSQVKDIKDSEGAYVMPKATILTEAKSTILFLNDKDRCDELEIKRLMIQNVTLFGQLRELKAQLQTNNVPGRAVVNEACRSQDQDIEEVAMQPVIKTECVDDSFDTRRDLLKQKNAIPISLSKSDVVVDSTDVDCDVDVESLSVPPVYDNGANSNNGDIEVVDLACTEQPVEEYELEFHPV